MRKWIINPLNQKSKIHKEIYGHFSEHLGRCIYEGLYVGENSPIPNENGMRRDVVTALKEMKIPVLRWPGGCFADEYHWKDGIGPKEQRKKMINTHWGGVIEDNSFGTHEFMELCRQLGCEAYINANVGSGTVQEMSEWVEYLTFSGVSPMADLRRKNGRDDPWNVAFWGVGNENWGCGGNMTPDYYANEYCRYATYCRDYDGKKLFKIACGANTDDYDWTEQVMKRITKGGPGANGISLHYYTVPTGIWDKKGSATDFDADTYYATISRALYMDELVRRHSQIMDRYDPTGQVSLIVDEWGTWYDVEPGTNPGFLYQQNTMRDAMVASITLDIFHKHSDRVRMANIAQLVNVLQSVILTEGERMVLTPTYYVFKMFQNHQDSTLIDSFIQTQNIGTPESSIPDLYESASVSGDGTLNLSLTNLSLDKEQKIDMVLVETPVHEAEAWILTGNMNSHNTFDQPNQVKAEPFTNFTVTEKGISFTAPPCSVVQFTVK
ncbi:MAG: alpha-N-arabinofuranosidase [Massiliimalia sp.]|jgi:alpha-N-arabinofuranosidase